MEAITDFEYSYKVFTPLENLTETGFVAKFVRRDAFDLELSVKFSKYKVKCFRRERDNLFWSWTKPQLFGLQLGIVANGKPKLKILRLFGLQRSDALASKLLDEHTLFKAFETEDEDDEDEEGDSDTDYEPLNIVGNMELDIIVWPTILGTIDVEEVGDTYFAFGNVKTKHGIIEFKDIFYYPVS